MKDGKRYMQLSLTDKQFKAVRMYLADRGITFQDFAIELVLNKVQVDLKNKLVEQANQ